MRTRIAAMMAVIGVGAAAHGQSLTLDTSMGLQAEAARQPEATPTAPAEAPPAEAVTASAPAPAAIGFGRAGSSFLGVGGVYSNDFDDNHAGGAYVAYSHFIADDIEFNLELYGLYFNQEGDDAAGINPIMNFRWHFLHDDAYDWTVFGEAGIGLLFAFDNVPDGGTGFNFTPRVGAGFTKALDDSGTRLMMGVRWQHISNGRIEGDERNPGRDSVMVFAGLVFPF